MSESINELKERLDALPEHPNDETIAQEKVATLVKLAQRLYRLDPEQAEGYGRRGLSLADRIGFRKGSAECNLIMGTSFWVRGNYNEALQHYAEALTICNETGDRKSAASCYSNIGLIHRNRGDYDQALACHLRALRIKEDLGDKSGIAKAYNNIGIIYDEESDYDHALEYYRKALKLFEELADKQGIAFSYNNVGVVHEAKGETALALEHYCKSLQIKEELGDKKGIASSYLNIGTLHDEQEEYHLALEHCHAALRMFEEVTDRRGMANAHNHIGRILARLGRYDEALTHLRKGLHLAQEIGTKDLEAVSYEYLTEYHQARGDFEQALGNHKRFSDLREKIFSEESAEKIAQMQVRYETEAREREAEIYRGMFENTLIGMYRTTPEGRFLTANSSLLLMLGCLSFDELQSDTIHDVRCDSLETARVFHEAFARDDVVLGYESAWQRRNGLSLPVRESARAIRDQAGNVLYYEGIVENITYQKRTEDALRKEKEFIDAALNAQLDTFFLFEPSTGKALRWNRVFREVSGYSEEEIAALPAPVSYYSPEDLERAKALIAKVLEEGTGTIELELICKDGKKVPFEYRASVIADERAEPRYIIAIGRDITERRRAEAALRESEEKFRVLVQHQGEGILAVDENECFTFANPAAERKFGVEPGDLVGRNLSEFVDEETFRFLQSQTELRRRGDSASYDVEITRFDGEKRQLSVTATPRLSSDGKFMGTLGIFRDVTDYRKTERALQASRQKVEDLHGIAHRLTRCEREPDVYSLAVDGTGEIIEFCACILYIAEGTKLVPKVTEPASCLSSSDLQTTHERVALKTLKSGKTQAFEWPDEQCAGKTSPKDEPSGISMPIADLGVFQVCSADVAAFTEDDAHLLELLLEHVAEGLRRIRLEEALRDQAIHDSLTGAFNRRHLDQALRLELKRCERENKPLDLLMIDIDRFKEINDRFGHQVGDRVLQRVAGLLMEETRETDVIVRYGGDEFLVLLSGTEVEPEALKARLSQRVARGIAKDHLVDFPVTLSIGWARWSPDRAHSSEVILAEADRHMYESKRSRPTAS